jgi:hypothetical protein
VTGVQTCALPICDELAHRAVAAAGRFRSGLGDLAARHDYYGTDPVND